LLTKRGEVLQPFTQASELVVPRFFCDSFRLGTHCIKVPSKNFGGQRKRIPKAADGRYSRIRFQDSAVQYKTAKIPAKVSKMLLRRKVEHFDEKCGVFLLMTRTQ
jgi:hypothetical protein